MDFLLIGVPSILPESLAFIINIEIIMLNFFLFNVRNKKQLPLMRNFNYFISWHRKLVGLLSFHAQFEYKKGGDHQL